MFKKLKVLSPHLILELSSSLALRMISPPELNIGDNKMSQHLVLPIQNLNRVLLTGHILTKL